MASRISVLFSLLIFFLTANSQAQTLLRVQQTFDYGAYSTPKNRQAFRVTYWLTPIPVNIKTSDFKPVPHRKCTKFLNEGFPGYDADCAAWEDAGWLFQEAQYPAFEVEREILDLKTGLITRTKLPDAKLIVAPYYGVEETPELPSVSYFQAVVALDFKGCFRTNLYTRPEAGPTGSPEVVATCIESRQVIEIWKDADGFHIPTLMVGAPAKLHTFVGKPDRGHEFSQANSYLKWEQLEVRP